jgi:large subunit ribosomal protein L4
MKIDLVNQENNTLKSIEISDAVFKTDVNEGLIHELVTSYRSNGRSATKAQKNRSRVNGGGAKPWRQKGTGRARAGTSRSPLWVGGGMAFATVERNYSKKINKKAYKRAMQSIFSTLIKEKRVVAIESIQIDSPKTKLAASIIKTLGIESALIIVSDQNANLELGMRNLPRVKVISAESVDPISLLSYENIIIDEAALKKIEVTYS